MEKYDLLLKNCQIVDFVNKTFNLGNIAIKGKKIVAINTLESANEVIDCKNQYVLPSFIDTHLHFESSQLIPSEYLKQAVAWGTTSFIADPHEIANVCGEDGIAFIVNDTKNLPCNVKVMMPSCVPATKTEENNAILDADACINIAKKYNLFGLGEMMDTVGVLTNDADTLKKIESFHFVDGHAPGLTKEDLKTYIKKGIYNDHECQTKDEALERIENGMTVFIREGSAAKNLCEIIKAINKDNVDKFTFCTDDKDVEELFKYGTISHSIALAIKNGIDPIDAIKIATINGYKYYEMKEKGLIMEGYDADLVVVPSLNMESVSYVFFEGNMVGRNNMCLFDNAKIDDSKVKNTVNIAPLSISDYGLDLKEGMPGIEIVPGSLFTKEIKYLNDMKVNYLYNIERHKATGHFGKCFVKGFEIENGAIAQTIGHDSHNITAIGDNFEDIKKAVDALQSEGGIVIVNNGEITKLHLPIAGLMSDSPALKLKKDREIIHEALKKIAPAAKVDVLMLLSFMSLIVIPELKLTTKGLFRFSTNSFI